VEVHERSREGREGDEHAGGDVADQVAAEDSADDTNEHRIRREEHDVLLRGRVERRVLVAVRHDLQIPPGVPPNGQIQQLVREMTQRRVTLRVSEHEDGQVTDEQNDRPRSGERCQRDADCRHARPGRQQERKLPIERLLRRRDMPYDTDAKRPQEQWPGRRDADADGTEAESESADNATTTARQASRTQMTSSTRTHDGTRTRSVICTE
jgi:hypothetical protein